MIRIKMAIREVVSWGISVSLTPVVMVLLWNASRNYLEEAV